MVWAGLLFTMQGVLRREGWDNQASFFAAFSFTPPTWVDMCHLATTTTVSVCPAPTMDLHPPTDRCPRILNVGLVLVGLPGTRSAMPRKMSSFLLVTTLTQQRMTTTVTPTIPNIRVRSQGLVKLWSRWLLGVYISPLYRCSGATSNTSV